MSLYMRREPRRCYWCGCRLKKKGGRPRSATIDHLTPTSRGGATHGQNAVPCCFACNQKKADMTAEEFIAIHGRGGDVGSFETV